MEDPLFASCYDSVRAWAVGVGDVSPATIISFVTRVMALLQTLVELRGDGARKKRLCLAIVRKVVVTEVTFETEADRLAVQALLQPAGLVDATIDILVGAARGSLKRAGATGASGCCVVS